MPFQARNLLQGIFVNDCRTMSNAELVEKWVYRQTPYAFRSAAAPFGAWRDALAACFGLEPGSIRVVGSTAAGLSLSPTKRLRLHSPQSDVDLAVISEDYFQTAWDWFVAKRIEFMSFPKPVKEWMEDQKRRLIFYRQIASDQYLEYLPFGKVWTTCLEAASNRAPVGGRIVKVRIYADHAALTNYLTHGVSELRGQLGI